jgi:hypothetical protein
MPKPHLKADPGPARSPETASEGAKPFNQCFNFSQEEREPPYNNQPGNTALIQCILPLIDESVRTKYEPWESIKHLSRPAFLALSNSPQSRWLRTRRQVRVRPGLVDGQPEPPPRRHSAGVAILTWAKMSSAHYMPKCEIPVLASISEPVSRNEPGLQRRQPILNLNIIYNIYE